jgi:hypothetical protein
MWCSTRVCLHVSGCEPASTALEMHFSLRPTRRPKSSLAPNSAKCQDCIRRLRLSALSHTSSRRIFDAESADARASIRGLPCGFSLERFTVRRPTEKLRVTLRSRHETVTITARV